MSQKIDTIVFDIGGVLIDWNPRYLYRKIFQTEEEITWFMENVCTHEWNEKQDAGRPFAEATAELVARFPEHEAAISAWYGRWTETIGGHISGTVEILEELKRADKHRLYALTNWSAESFPWAFDNFKFLGLFEGIVVSGAEKTRKPFPEFYKILLDRYQIAPSKALFIDDSLRNVNGAIDVGMKAVQFVSPEKLKYELKSLDIL